MLRSRENWMVIEVDPSDQQIQNIIAAIEKEAAQIDWQPAPLLRK